VSLSVSFFEAVTEEAEPTPAPAPVPASVPEPETLPLPAGPETAEIPEMSSFPAEQTAIDRGDGLRQGEGEGEGEGEK
jgi:hypothetical protein